MSDTTPDRTIAGLTPRTVDLTRMQARNRPQPAEEPPALASLAEQPKPTAPKTQKRDTPKKRTALTTAVEEKGARITTYLAASLRNRAQAAYRATSHLEGDTSWSDYVERAILTETQRREAEHNAGEPYKGDGSRLSAGRPLG